MFNGNNQLDFLGGFPDIATHFVFFALIYGEVQEQPVDDGDERDKWDHLNALALAKLKFYVLTGVHSIIWKGKALTANQYYQFLYAMFLAGTCGPDKLWRRHGTTVIEVQGNNYWIGGGDLMEYWQK